MNIDDLQSEIVLSEGLNIDPGENTFKKITLKFHQEQKSNKQRKKYFVFDNKYLGVKDFGSARKEFWINLLFLDIEAIHQKKTPGLLCFVALGLILIAVLLILILRNTDFVLLDSFYVFSIIILLITSALLLILYIVYRTTDVLIFYSQNGKIALVEFFYNNPNKNEFEQFIHLLAERIERIKNSNKYDKSQLLPAELSEHRRLHEEGIISDKDYVVAKNNILKCY